MPRLTLEEKRLETLRRQLYGKAGDQKSPKKEPVSSTPSGYHIDLPSTPSTSGSIVLDENYLRKDLLKIFLLSGLAIGAELILYLASTHHLINLHF